MKTSTKAIIVLLIVIGGMAWYLSVLYKKANEERKPGPIPEAAKTKVQTQATKIADEVDKHGLKHAVLKLVKEIDQSAVDRVKADLMDTVEKLNITRDQLRQVIVINANLTIAKQRLERKVGLLATTYVHNDDNFRLSVNVPNDSLQAATFDAGYDADLITTQYNKGNWLTGNKPYMDIYSNDPRFTIKGARTLTVKQKQPMFNANLQATTEYNFNTKSFAAGPTLNISIGRVEIRGKYLYDPSDKQWNGIISGGYMLLRK